MEPNWEKLESEYYRHFDPYDIELTDYDRDDIVGDQLLDPYKDETISLD